MKLSSFDVTSCNDLCFSRKGRVGRGGWVGLPEGPPLGSALEMPWLALSLSLLSSYARTGWVKSPLALPSTHFWWESIYCSLGEQLPAECCDS